MGKLYFSGVVKRVQASVNKHSPEILTGIGIAGMIATTIMAVKATPKALILIDNKKKDDLVDRLTPVETVKTTWKCYIPSVITGGLSIACLIGASSTNARRNAALATAYTLSETALKDYRGKVVETLGEKKEKTIRDAIAKDQLNQNPVNNKEVIITKKGDMLCYDALSGRYFKADIDALKKAENELNRQMMNESYVSLNDLYYLLDLDNTNIGYDLGWNINKGFINLDFSSQLATDGTPCLVINYSVEPRYDYARY